MSNVFSAEFDEQMKLENLFMIWQQRMGPSQMPIEVRRRVLQLQCQRSRSL